MSTNTKWSHLPNAAHIDRVIASLKSHPDQWNAVGVWNAWNAAWKATIVAVRAAKRVKIWDTARADVWHVVSGALLCLIAYDDCGYMLDSEVDELKILAALGDQKAILLLPACIAFNLIKGHKAK